MPITLRQQRPFVIDVVGIPGSGKTTLSPLVVESVQSRRPDLKGHYDLSGHERLHLHPAARLKWTLRHPTILFYAVRCLSIRQSRKTIGKAYLGFLGLISRRSAILHGQAKLNSDFVIVDQGIVHRLYRKDASLITQLPPYLQPNMILELRCAPSEQFVRWLSRNKPGRKTALHLIREPERTPTAKRTLARIASVAAEKHWPALLKTWGEVYADPPLNNDEVAALVAGRLADPSPEAAPTDKIPERWGKQLPNIGLPWLIFDSGGGATPQQVADKIADAIVKALER